MRSPAPPGNEREPGAVKALACAAVAGWVWIPSILLMRSEVLIERTECGRDDRPDIKGSVRVNQMNEECGAVGLRCARSQRNDEVGSGYGYGYGYG